MAIGDEGAAPNQRSRGRGSRELCSRLARRLRFGLQRKHRAASIENAGAKSIVERHEPPLLARTELTNIPQVIALASASIGDVDVATATAIRAGQGLRQRRRTLYRYEPISLFEISLTDSSQTLPPEAPSAEVAMADPD